MNKKSEVKRLTGTDRFTIFKRDKYEYVTLNGFTESVMICPITDDGEIVFIKKYVSAENTIELVLPGGKVENGLTRLQTAKKELMEEIGMSAVKYAPLGQFKILPAYFLGKTYGFIAEGLNKNKDVEIDKTETIKVVTIPIKKVLDEIQSGKIRDVRTVAVVLYYFTFALNEFLLPKV